MRTLRVLKQLERVESEMAGLYGWLSEVFATDADVSGHFWPRP